MRFIIYGAGAIGGVVGAELHRAGQEVVLIARGAHLAAMRAGGLRYENPKGTVTLEIPAAAHPSEIAFRPGDVVLLTTKSQHTLGALEDLRRAAGDEVPVVCCQNGVANEPMALRRFRRVYGMLVYLPADALEPGLVQGYSKAAPGILDAGCYPGGSDRLVAELTELLEGANFSAKPVADVMRWKHGKLLLNLVNALQAICPSEDGASQIADEARQEAVRCFEAAGIAYASREEELARREGHLVMGEIGGRGRAGSSSVQSLMRGTGNIEADWMNGEIVLLGRLHGIATPVNLTLQRLANRLASERGAAQSMPIAALRQAIEETRRAG